MNVNKALILGNLVRDPELRQTASGQSVCTFDVATNRTWTTPGGEKNQKTEYHRIVSWGKLAEICGQYLKRGRSVYVEGRIETRSWQDKESGAKRFRTEIVADNIQMGPRTGERTGDEPRENEPARPTASVEDIASIQYPGETDDIEVKDIPF